MIFKKKRVLTKKVGIPILSLIAAVCIALTVFNYLKLKALPSQPSSVMPSASLQVINYSRDGKADLKISAKSAILIDADSGNILFEKNSSERLSMASTTKIMTALVAIENCPLDRVVSVSKEAVGVEGSSIYLYENEKITMEDLLYALLLESANDAATAIAIEVGGSVEEFASMMNVKARSIGLQNTNFENPHGLDSELHYTTAHDLAVIAMTAIGNSTFASIVSTAKKTIPLDTDSGVRLLINHNKLLRMYDGVIGVKTGFTKKSGRCLVSAAERDGVRLIAVTLNAPDDWNDHMKMLDYGFGAYEYVTLCNKGDFCETVPLVGGTDPYVTVANSGTVGVTLPKNHGDITYKVEMPNFVYAPVECGERLGRLVFYCDNKAVGSCDISSMYDIGAEKYRKGFFDFFRAIFE